MTGLPPNESGLYENGQSMREVLPNAEILPAYFRRHGYWAGGSGKLLHYFIDASSWNEYYPAKETENPFPRTLYPEKRPLRLPVGGPWQYVETDWGPLQATDELYGGDWLVSEWIGEQLERVHDEPFFLACGIYRPHEPWFVPEKYFAPFPLVDIQFPPGYLESDLDDLPAAGKRRGPNRYFDHIRAQGQWREGVQGYLASIAFADAMVGRVLDALERGPNAQNTVVVLWSDHGWQLGEKQHWQKYTAWRAVTRVPLIIRVPSGAPGLPAGTLPGSVCKRPVNLASLFATLVELAGLPKVEQLSPPSLTPLLRGDSESWEFVSTTFLSEPESYAVSADRWRYVHYAGGDEELYDVYNDPFEWTNLAIDARFTQVLHEMRLTSPKQFAPLVPRQESSLPDLTWNPTRELSVVPKAKPEGQSFNVRFINSHRASVKLYWMAPDGSRTSFGTLLPGDRKEQKTRPGAVWLICNQRDTPIGYFVIGDRRAKAVVPELSK
jgi:arylsulfatase A-like enzyme